jgi:hypothetical protein
MKAAYVSIVVLVFLVPVIVALCRKWMGGGE